MHSLLLSINGIVSSVITQLYSEALWLNFDGTPHKVKVAVNNVVENMRPINAVTGHEDGRDTTQDYLGEAMYSFVLQNELD